MCFTGVSFITASGCDTFMIFLVNGYAKLEKILKACDVKVHIWDKVFHSGLRKFCGRQPLKNFFSPLLNTLSHII